MQIYYSNDANSYSSNQTSQKVIFLLNQGYEGAASGLGEQLPLYFEPTYFPCSY